MFWQIGVRIPKVSVPRMKMEFDPSKFESKKCQDYFEIYETILLGSYAKAPKQISDRPHSEEQTPDGQRESPTEL